MALLLLLVLPPASAAAQVRLQAAGTVTSGVTNDPNPGSTGDSSDGFTEASPSLRLSISSGRAFHQLQYTFNGLFYYRYFKESSAYSNMLEWLGLILAGEGVRVRLMGDVNQGHQQSLSMQQGFTGGVQPDGRLVFISGRLEDQLEWTINDQWSAYQTFRATGFRALISDYAQPMSVEGELHLGGSRRLHRDHLVGLDVGSVYHLNLSYTETVDGGGEVKHPTAHIIIAQAFARWNYDFARDWSLEVNVGMLEANHSDDFSKVYYQPLGLVAVRFAREHAYFEASARYTMRPSLQLGETFRVAEARVIGRIPLGRIHSARWVVAATLGYDWAQRLALGCHELGNFMQAYLADVALEWRASDTLELSVRYQLNGQTYLPAEPHCMMMYTEVPGFRRHAALISATFRWPAERVRSNVSRRLRRPITRDVDWQRHFDATPGMRRESQDNTPGLGGGQQIGVRRN